MKLISKINLYPRIKAIILWLLVVPTILITFYLCVLVALGIHWTAESLCPPELIVSELCTAEYMSWVKEGLLLFMPAIASALMVFSSYFCAPNYKLIVATMVFIIGSLAAFYYALDSSYWLTFVATELSAATALFYCYKKAISLDTRGQ